MSNKLERLSMNDLTGPLASEGWEIMKRMYEGEDFAVDCIGSEDKSITDFELCSWRNAERWAGGAGVYLVLRG